MSPNCLHTHSDCCLQHPISHHGRSGELLNLSVLKTFLREGVFVCVCLGGGGGGGKEEGTLHTGNKMVVLLQSAIEGLRELHRQL